MDALLQITSRIEAAVEAYKSVWDFSDSSEWKKKFAWEMVGAHLHGV